MDRDHKLRLVGAENLASVSRDPTLPREYRPPEHASPEAMLRWARAQRSLNNLAPGTGEVAKTAQTEFVSLAFAALGKGGAFPADSAPLSYIRKVRRVKAYVIAGSIALVLVVAVRVGLVLFGSNVSQPVGATTEMASPGNSDLQLSLTPTTFAVDGQLPAQSGEKFAENSISAPITGYSRSSRFALLGQAVQMAEPELTVAADDSVAYAVPVAAKLDDGTKAGLAPLNVAVFDKFVPPEPVPNLVAGIDNPGKFVPPAQYSRQDLGTGAGDLFRLISGQDSAANAANSVQLDRLLATRPSIYVHHGLGVSPETVRKVMQKLSGDGYESIFQVGVPFRIGRTNVRFYHKGDKNLAQEIAESVIPLVDGPQFTAPRDFSRYSKPPRAGTIDIWLSDKA